MPADPRNDGDRGEQVAIVTRAAGAIERATALRLARHGMRLVICDDVDGDGLETTRKEAEAVGAPVLAVAADIAREADADRVADAAVSRFGRVDVLVNGMASGDLDRVPEDSSPDVADGIVAGVRGPLFCTRAVVPHMTAGGGGRIVNVTSSAGRYRSAYFRYTGDDGGHARAAGIDGALLALTRELAFELAARRIRVNAATIGWLRTPAAEQAWRRLSSQDRSFVLEEISLRRLGEPDEAAAVIEFLATDASSYVTGAAIDVNGGWWMS